MTAMIAEVYEALKEAGASDGEATAAAKAIAEHENRFTMIEADLLVLKWMIGAILAGVASLVAKAFFG
jgi:L-serine deaminase